MKVSSVEDILMCELAPLSPALISPLTCAHCASAHVSVAERTEPTHSHPRAFALTVLSVSMFFLLPPDICRTESYSAFWSQPKCHLSLTIVHGAIPYPMFSHALLYYLWLYFLCGTYHLLKWPQPHIACLWFLSHSWCQLHADKEFVLFSGCRHHNWFSITISWINWTETDLINRTCWNFPNTSLNNRTRDRTISMNPKFSPISRAETGSY